MSEENYEDDVSQEEISEAVEPAEQEEPFQEEVSEEPQQESGDEALSDETEIQAEAPKPKTKGRVSGKTRINQLYREKSQAEYEAAQLRAEVERLRQLSVISNNAAMTHYDNNIQLQLERAKHMKTEAIQNNDVEAQVEADLIMSRTAAQLEALEAYKAQNRGTKQVEPQQQYVPQQPTQQLNEETETWLQDNQWFIPGNAEYDPEMQEEVQAFADALDRKLRRTGQSSKILTQDYFNEINDYVAREFYNEEPPTRSRNLTMRPASTRAPVAPVSRSSQPSNIKSRQQQIRLTPEQREIARLSGLTEQSYIRGMIDSNQMLKDKGRA